MSLGGSISSLRDQLGHTSRGYGALDFLKDALLGKALWYTGSVTPAWRGFVGCIRKRDRVIASPRELLSTISEFAQQPCGTSQTDSPIFAGYLVVFSTILSFPGFEITPDGEITAKSGFLSP